MPVPPVIFPDMIGTPPLPQRDRLKGPHPTRGNRAQANKVLHRGFREYSVWLASASVI